MRHRFVIPLLIAVFAFGVTAASGSVRVIKDGLELTFDADFAPHALPRDHSAPVSVKVSGRIATTDGSHPPPLRWLEIAIHRNGHLYTKGLPVCSAPVLQSTSTKAALERCGPALVGRGSFKAEVQLGEEILASGKILAFNSRRHGKPALVMHLFAGVPVRFTLIVPLTIGHPGKGRFGTVLRAKLPRLGGGLGSVTEINLTIDRRYTYAGKRRSYVSAACSAPGDFTVVPFVFARGTFRFEGHSQISENLEQVCQVRR
jgi:hypothetical protein